MVKSSHQSLNLVAKERRVCPNELNFFEGEVPWKDSWAVGAEEGAARDGVEAWNGFKRRPQPPIDVRILLKVEHLVELS